MLLPYMESVDMTMQLIANGMDILLMPAASAFETPEEPTAGLTTATVLKTGPHAYVRNLSDGVDVIDRQDGDRQGEITVGLFAHRMHANGNVSRLFALGCSATLMNEYIYGRASAGQGGFAGHHGLHCAAPRADGGQSDPRRGADSGRAAADHRGRAVRASAQTQPLRRDAFAATGQKEKNPPYAPAMADSGCGGRAGSGCCIGLAAAIHAASRSCDGDSGI